jgi:FAD/FMN-containing dehydrogenase/Fe-S oxidoreductase
VSSRERLAFLRSRLGDALDTTPLSRAIYSSDASAYRLAPLGVYSPRTPADVVTAVAAAAEAEVPVTTRGAGTSCCGNAIGSGLILDLSRHLTSIVGVDPDARRATVQPGVVQASLQRAAAPFGLRFGPDPSTSDRCTLGGMIGNNACGPRALGYGRTSDNLLAVTVVLASGETVTLEPAGSRHDRRRGRRTRGRRRDTGRLERSLGAIASRGADVIATEFGRFDRQLSGYALDQLAVGNLPGLVAGSEGTLGIVTEAVVRLVEDSPVALTVVLGYPSMVAAADDIGAVLRHSPTACEGLDHRIVDVVRRRGLPVPGLPRGTGWTMVELVGHDLGETRSRARRLIAESDALDGWLVTDPAQAKALWRIRADGAGLASVAFERRAHAGWEDSAVPPTMLGAYLRDFEALLAAHELHGLPYGHFGDGCVHCRIDFPLLDKGGRKRFRRFMSEAADLVAGYNGSLSGEHGDGRARSELLDRIYSPAALALMKDVKDAFDPDHLLNPGILVPAPGESRPARFAADLREAELRGPIAGRTPLAHQHPEFTDEVHRCAGLGKCLVDAGSVMCPSFHATGRQQDSTRGRARVLQEMLRGDLITDGWSSPEVLEALDLCLSCKGCAAECPTGTDIADYKSQVLDKAYKGRLRPASHYSMGWLPLWGRIISRAGLAGTVNRLGASPFAPVVKRLAGVHRRRGLPRFAAGSAATRTTLPSGRGEPVAIWVDSWTDTFAGGHAEAVATVLTAAGFAPRFAAPGACCGLPWITTGQRAQAAKHLRQAARVLAPLVADGIPVVATEPSCLAVWRSDARGLIGAQAAVGEHIVSVAEFLVRAGWEPPDLSGRSLVVQPHCHHRAAIGWETDAALLARTGADIVTVDGCCGLAGNFGFERDHYDVSVQVAEHDLLPALREHPDAQFVADGFSCRTQATDLTGRPALTLAELLAAELTSTGDA